MNTFCLILIQSCRNYGSDIFLCIFAQLLVNILRYGNVNNKQT